MTSLTGALAGLVAALTALRSTGAPNGSIRTRVTDPTPISADEFSIWGQQYLYPGVAKWHPGYCNKCDVVTVPYALRWLDWQYVLNWRIKDWWRWKALPRLRSLTRGG